jgi:DNA-binding MarR family transcriptional regulator
MGITGRISRAARLLSPELAKVFVRFELSALEFDTLATLRRSESPLTPTQLYQTLMLSSGAMSTRIDQLVKRGLLVRLASGEDRRSNKVALTDEGKALIDAAVEAHVGNLHRLVSVLTDDEQAQLASLMRKLLAGLEAEDKSQVR